MLGCFPFPFLCRYVTYKWRTDEPIEEDLKFKGFHPCRNFTILEGADEVTVIQLTG